MTNVKKYLLSAILFVGILSFGVLYVIPYLQNQKYAFDLQGSQDRVRLSDFGDKNIILYFGYLSCPDVCPSTLEAVKNVFDKLSIQERNSFKVIFISIDPDRDKPQELDSYVQYFIPDSIGATGTHKELEKLEEPYRVYYVKDKSSSAMGYTVSHTSSLYFFKTRNRLYKRLSTQHDNENEIYKTIREML